MGGAWFNRARAADHLGYREEALEAYREAQARLDMEPRYAEFSRRARERLQQLEQPKRLPR